MNVTVTPGRLIMGRLAKGDDLLSALESRCQARGIKLGEVRAIGAVSQAHLGYYDQTAQKYQVVSLQKPLEIVSLLGNISLKDGKPFVHAHLTLADKGGQAWGGHLAAETVVFACEFVIQEYLSEESLSRHFDPETGLFLWPQHQDQTGS